MSRKIYITILIALATMLCSLSANGQVKVIGHVFAEVVESVSVKSDVVTDFKADFSSAEANEELSLGSVTIAGSSHISYNVMMSRTAIKNSNGSELNMEISSARSEKSMVEIKGRLAENNQAGQYKGSYTMIFAYN